MWRGEAIWKRNFAENLLVFDYIIDSDNTASFCAFRVFHVTLKKTAFIRCGFIIAKLIRISNSLSCYELTDKICLSKNGAKLHEIDFSCVPPSIKSCVDTLALEASLLCPVEKQKKMLHNPFNVACCRTCYLAHSNLTNHTKHGASTCHAYIQKFVLSENRRKVAWFPLH